MGNICKRLIEANLCNININIFTPTQNTMSGLDSDLACIMAFKCSQTMKIKTNWEIQCALFVKVITGKCLNFD